MFLLHLCQFCMYRVAFYHIALGLVYSDQNITVIPNMSFPSLIIINLYLFCDQSHDMTPNLPNLTLWAFGFFCFYFHSMFRSYCFMLMPSFIFYLPKGLVRNNSRALRPKYTLHCRVHTKIAENH